MRHAQTSAAVADARRSRRYTVDIKATIAGEDEADHPVRVIDLSRRGFGAETGAIPPIDALVTLTLPGVCHARARVVWSESGRFGAEFLAPQRLYLIPSVIEQAAGLTPTND